MEENSSRYIVENNDTPSFWGQEVPLIQFEHLAATENDTRIPDHLTADDEAARNIDRIVTGNDQKRYRDEEMINNSVDINSDTHSSKKLKRSEATTTATNVSSNNKHNDVGWSSMFDRLMAFRAQHGVRSFTSLSMHRSISFKSHLLEYVISPRSQHCLVPKRYAADPQL
jgi:hypothetical protein